jgi:CheY-like chemotaxis protein
MALTANALAESERLCAEAGMDGCLIKPLRMEQVRAALQRAEDRASTLPGARLRSN